MRISPKLIYANIICLLLNTAFLLLAVFKLCSFLLSVAIFVVCLAGLVWLSYQLNRPPTKKVSFHSAPTEKSQAID